MNLFVFVLETLLLCQVYGAYKFICHKCARDHVVEGFDDEDAFIKHSEWHVEQQAEAQKQLIEDARLEQEQDDLRPKLFHCHHCQFITSFNSSSEFINHVDTVHKRTTVEENLDFVPKGNLKAGYRPDKRIPPELSNLDAEMGNNYGGGMPFGGMGGGGGGGAFDGMLQGQQDRGFWGAAR